MWKKNWIKIKRKLKSINKKYAHRYTPTYTQTHTHTHGVDFTSCNDRACTHTQTYTLKHTGTNTIPLLYTNTHPQKHGVHFTSCSDRACSTTSLSLNKIYPMPLPINVSGSRTNRTASMSSWPLGKAWEKIKKRRERNNKKCRNLRKQKEIERTKQSK